MTAVAIFFLFSQNFFKYCLYITISYFTMASSGACQIYKPQQVEDSHSQLSLNCKQFKYRSSAKKYLSSPRKQRRVKRRAEKMEIVPYKPMKNILHSSDDESLINGTMQINKWADLSRYRLPKGTKSKQVCELVTNYEKQLMLKEQENQLLRNQLRGLQKEVQDIKGRKTADAPENDVTAVTEINEAMAATFGRMPTSEDIIPMYFTSSDDDNIIELSSDEMIVDESNVDIDDSDSSTYYTEVTEVDVYDDDDIKGELLSDTDGSEQYEEVEIDGRTEEEIPLLDNPTVYMEAPSNESNENDLCEERDVITLLDIEPSPKQIHFCHICSKELSSIKVLRVSNAFNSSLLPHLRFT